MGDKTKNNHGTLQLKRLETLTDVVYAIVIWNFFTLIPDPAGEWPWRSILSFLISNWMTLVLVVIGVLVSIIYWTQNNSLLGSLERTDGLHTGFSIFQLLFLLFFFYALHLGVAQGGSTGTRAFESGAVLLMGIAATLGWSYAIRNRRLLMSKVTDQEAHEIANRTLAEPITALITIPFAFASGILWEISWLSYIPVLFLLKRWGRDKMS